MKQSTLIRNKQWDVLAVLDVLDVSDVDDGVVIVTDSRYDQYSVWLERNWGQFRDGTFKDVSLFSAHKYPWGFRERVSLKVFRDAEYVGAAGAAISRARGVLSLPGSGRVFLLLGGGMENLSALRDLASALGPERSVAVTAMRNSDGGLVVPWAIMGVADVPIVEAGETIVVEEQPEDMAVVLPDDAPVAEAVVDEQPVEEDIPVRSRKSRRTVEQEREQEQ
jgi:hypothetical protein